MDRHRRPILGREGEPLVSRSYPADADAPAKGGAVLRKVVLKTGGWQGIIIMVHPQFFHLGHGAGKRWGGHIVDSSMGARHPAQQPIL